MLYMIRLWVLHYTLPKYVFLGNFVIYLYYAWVILSLCIHYICAFIDMFMHIILVSVLKFLCMLYNILIGCTSSWVFFLSLSYARVILPLNCRYMCVHINMLWMLYLSLMRYVCVIHKIYSLVVLHLGNLFMNIYCIVFVCHCCHPHWLEFTKMC